MRLRNIPGSKEDVLKYPFVIADPYACRGRWKELFPPDLAAFPLHVEIGMGKGRFLTRMAAAHPDVRYIGIEMYSSVLLRAAQARERLEEDGGRLPNLLYIRMDARELPDVFAPEEVSRIYLNFSDPWPKERHADRRLTSRRFLARYRLVLPKNAAVEFKTDNKDLFAFSLEEAKAAGWPVLVCTWDLHADFSLCEDNIMTEYEEKFSGQGVPICKAVFQCP